MLSFYVRFQFKGTKNLDFLVSRETFSQDNLFRWPSSWKLHKPSEVQFEVPQIEHFTDFLKMLSTRKFFTWSILGTLEVDFGRHYNDVKHTKTSLICWKPRMFSLFQENFLRRNISLCKIVLAGFRYVEEFLLRKTFDCLVEIILRLDLPANSFECLARPQSFVQIIEMCMMAIN